MRDRVGPGHGAVHPVERCGLGGPQVGAAVLQLLVPQRGDAAVRRHRRLQTRLPVRRRTGGGQVLQPILDPFDRTARQARRRRHQHDVGCQALLDPETPPRIRRGAKPQAVGRHAERHRHDRVQGEGPLEGCGDVVGVGVGVVLGDDAEAFDRRGGVARIGDLDRDRAVRGREGGLGVAVPEMPFADAYRTGIPRAGRRGQRLVVDTDMLEGVLGKVAVGRKRHGDRLADVADGVAGDREMVRSGAQRRDERPQDGADPGTRQDTHVPGDVDAPNAGVRVGRAQYRGVQRPRRDRQVVDETTPPPQQRGILDPRPAAAHGAGPSAAVAANGLIRPTGE